MKISVALCTYNGEKFLREQLDSILNQTRKVDEIVICDDVSSDKTIEILNDYNLKNKNLFRIYRNEVNLRSVKNFEKAISLCTGDIIFLSDQDDVWVLNKVATYETYFNENPSITVLASNGYCIDEHSKVHDRYSIWDVPEFLREKNIAFDYFTFISVLSNLATGSTMAFKKEILSEAIPIPEIKGFHHDEWIALLGAKNNSFELLNEKFYYYRIHDAQQVGGVFFDKTKKIKNKFTEIFDLDSKNHSFTGIKSKIKRLILSYEKNKLLGSSVTSHQVHFIKNTEIIKAEIIKMTAILKKKYYIAYLILTFSDKILNKRQLPF